MKLEGQKKIYVIILLFLSTIFSLSAQMEEALPIEEILGPIIEHTVGKVVGAAAKKIRELKGKKQLKIAQENQDELKNVFLGELGYRIASFAQQLPAILQSSDAEKLLKERLNSITNPFLPLIVHPEFTLARGLTPTIFHNLFMYTKLLQKSFYDEFEQLIAQKPLPSLELFKNKIEQYKQRIAVIGQQIIDDIAAQVDPKKEGISASSAIKIVRKPSTAPKTVFDEIVEASVIALRPVHQNNYLTQTNEKVELSCEYPYKDEAAQFLVERYGKAAMLNGKFGYLCVNPVTQEVFHTRQKLAPEAQWIFEGDELGSVVLKNNKTGAFLSIDGESSLVATKIRAEAAHFECSILNRPWNHQASAYPLLNQLPAGTTVALKINSPLGTKYLSVDSNGFVTAQGNSSDDWRCRFDIMRFGNYVGFKHIGWKNICIDPVTWTVYVAQRSSMLFSATEQWIIDPKSPESLKSVRLINRASGGYLRAPTDWSKGRVTTAGSKKPNPVLSFSSLTTLPSDIYEAAPQEQALDIEIKIIKAAPTDITPGKNSLSFVPAIHGKNNVLFGGEWMLTPGMGTLLLKGVQAPASIYIALSDKPAITKNTVYVVVGDEKNTKSGIRVYGSMAISITNKQNPDAVITKSEDEALWVTLKDSVVSFGKGLVPGINQIASVQLEASVAKKIAYFGLGGGGNRVSFGSISWKKE